MGLTLGCIIVSLAELDLAVPRGWYLFLAIAAVDLESLGA